MYTASMPKAVQVVGLYAIPTNPSSSIALNTSAPAANVSSRPVLSAPGSWVSPAGFSLGPVKTDSLFSLGVTAPDGVSKKVYLLDVVRLAGNDASLRSLNATVNGTVIQLDLRADPVQVPGLTAGATSARFSWAATDAAAASAYSLDGTTVLSGSAVTLSLSPGANSFKVRVTSEDGATTKWYTVNAVVPVTAGATLANMSTDPGLLVPAFSPSVAQYSVRLPSNVAVFVLYASAADPTVKISFTGTGQPSLNFPGEMRFKPDVGAVVLGVNPSASGPAGKYTLTVTALKDYEMLPYLDFTGSQSGMGYQTPLSSSSSPFPDSGGLRTTAGQPVQFQVATNCSRYQRDFGGDLTLCGGLGSLVVQLILGPPGFRGAASLVTNATCTIANGTLSYTPVAAGTYTVQAGLATCQQIAGYCDPAKYNTLSLQQVRLLTFVFKVTLRTRTPSQVNLLEVRQVFVHPFG